MIILNNQTSAIASFMEENEWWNKTTSWTSTTTKLKDNCKLCISKHAQQAQTRTPLQSYKIVIKC